jgi:hypothetical protein
MLDVRKRHRRLVCALVQIGNLVGDGTQRRVEACDDRGELVEAAMAQIAGRAHEAIEVEQAVAQPAIGVAQLLCGLGRRGPR